MASHVYVPVGRCVGKRDAGAAEPAAAVGGRHAGLCPVARPRSAPGPHLEPVGESVVTFRVVGPIRDQETFAVGRRIRELKRLQKQYGRGRWRKRKGVAFIRLADGTIRQAELHWYEASGIGQKEFKLKRFLD